MSLGVLNNLSAIYAENNLNNTSSSLQKVLQQLSSGSKINSGADDAAGLSLVNGLTTNSAALTQSSTNATEGVGLLQVADGALSQVTSLLDRAVTLATEASNGTLNSNQEAAANQEYQSILAEVNNIGSTTTYNQNQVFGGNTVAIYTGDSSSAGSSIDNISIRALSSSSVGDTNGQMSYNNGASNVFLDLSTLGKNASTTDTLNASGATTISVTYLTKGSGGSSVSASANINVGSGTSYANTAQGLINAINGAGLGLSASFGTAANAGTAATATAVAGTQQTTTLKTSSADTGIIISGTGVGVNNAGANGVGEVGTVGVTNTTSAADSDTAILSGTLSIVGFDGVTHAITLGTANSTDTLSNLAATINSAGYGVTATYNATVGTNGADVVLTSADSAVTVSQTSLSAAGAGAATAASLTGTPAATGTANSTTLATVTGAATAAGNLVIGTNTIAVTLNETIAQQATAINAGNYGVKATLNAGQTTMTLTSADSVAPTITDAAGSVVTAVGTTNSPYYNVGISGSVYDSSTTGGTATLGMSGDNNGSNGIATISYSDGTGANLAGTDLLNQADAQLALTGLNQAVTDASSLDGYIGAQINTLQSIGQVISTQQENVVSAQNAIQATDYASATSNMSKYEILSQTGIAALAQANSVEQEVTKLLQ